MANSMVWRNYKGIFKNLTASAPKSLRIIKINTSQFYTYSLRVWRKCRLSAGSQRTLWTFRHRASANISNGGLSEGRLRKSSFLVLRNTEAHWQKKIFLCMSNFFPWFRQFSAAYSDSFSRPWHNVCAINWCSVTEGHICFGMLKKRLPFSERKGRSEREFTLHL
jgi:hypothetical protein